jgi:hypothetical protein
MSLAVSPSVRNAAARDLNLSSYKVALNSTGIETVTKHTFVPEVLRKPFKTDECEQLSQDKERSKRIQSAIELKTPASRRSYVKFATIMLGLTVNDQPFLTYGVRLVVQFFSDGVISKDDARYALYCASGKGAKDNAVQAAIFRQNPLRNWKTNKKDSNENRLYFELDEHMTTEKESWRNIVNKLKGAIEGLSSKDAEATLDIDLVSHLMGGGGPRKRKSPAVAPKKNHGDPKGKGKIPVDNGALKVYHKRVYTEDPKGGTAIASGSGKRPAHKKRLELLTRTVINHTICGKTITAEPLVIEGQYDFSSLKTALENHGVELDDDAYFYSAAGFKSVREYCESVLEWLEQIANTCGVNLCIFQKVVDGSEMTYKLEVTVTADPIVTNSIRLALLSFEDEEGIRWSFCPFMNSTVCSAGAAQTTLADYETVGEPGSLAEACAKSLFVNEHHFKETHLPPWFRQEESRQYIGDLLDEIMKKIGMFRLCVLSLGQHSLYGEEGPMIFVEQTPDFKYYATKVYHTRVIDDHIPEILPKDVWHIAGPSTTLRGQFVYGVDNTRTVKVNFDAELEDIKRQFWEIYTDEINELSNDYECKLVFYHFPDFSFGNDEHLVPFTIEEVSHVPVRRIIVVETQRADKSNTGGYSTGGKVAMRPQFGFVPFPTEPEVHTIEIAYSPVTLFKDVRDALDDSTWLQMGETKNMQAKGISSTLDDDDCISFFCNQARIKVCVVSDGEKSIEYSPGGLQNIFKNTIYIKKYETSYGDQWWSLKSVLNEGTNEHAYGDMEQGLEESLANWTQDTLRPPDNPGMFDKDPPRALPTPPLTMERKPQTMEQRYRWGGHEFSNASTDDLPNILHRIL